MSLKFLITVLIMRINELINVVYLWNEICVLCELCEGVSLMHGL